MLHVYTGQDLKNIPALNDSTKADASLRTLPQPCHGGQTAANKMRAASRSVTWKNNLNVVKPVLFDVKAVEAICVKNETLSDSDLEVCSHFLDAVDAGLWFSYEKLTALVRERARNAVANRIKKNPGFCWKHDGAIQDLVVTEQAKHDAEFDAQMSLDRTYSVG